jgi:hypothetical protein
LKGELFCSDQFVSFDVSFVRIGMP